MFAITAAGSAAFANPFDGMRNGYHRVKEAMKRDFHRNNCWPEPFVRPDQVHVSDPLARMVANGWRRQNLLGDHHFSADAQALTEAGELKVEEILRTAPPQYRTIFVQRASNRDATAARLDAVEQYATGILPENVAADVQESHLVAEGRPAVVVDAVNVRFRETQPAPQLPRASTANTDF
jgi:hypothetical protein